MCVEFSVWQLAGLEDLGLTKEEQNEMKTLRRMRRRRELNFDEVVSYEALRQKMVDHVFEAQHDLIEEILASREFSCRENWRKVSGQGNS